MTDRWIWPFELLEKIGEGGMGVVYRARYVRNDRQVAVKFLPSRFRENKTHAIRFEREMEALKSLKHPHIVYCFGGTCEGKRQFYAMELVEGGTLNDVLKKRGRLSWEQAVSYGTQICSALAFAHQHGIIHRDIKPANFLIARSGKLKLSDFGLVRVLSGSRLTAADKTMGTLKYMAPEQFRGKPEISGQTDLYALGCVLFEMLTGRAPFQGDTAAEILHQHLNLPAPHVSSEKMDCPAALDKLIDDLLQKDPVHRPASAQEVARRLGNVTQTTVVESPGSGSVKPVVSEKRTPQRPPPNRRGVSFVVWPVTLLVICALGVWNLSLRDGAHRFRRSEDLWLQTFRHKDPSVRVLAASALGQLAVSSNRSLSALMDGLEDTDVSVRVATVRALGDCGAAARLAGPPLMKVQRTDENGLVRQEAQEALTRIESDKTGSQLGGFVLLGGAMLLGVSGLIVFRFSRQPADR